MTQPPPTPKVSVYAPDESFTQSLVFHKLMKMYMFYITIWGAGRIWQPTTAKRAPVPPRCHRRRRKHRCIDKARGHGPVAGA